MIEKYNSSPFWNVSCQSDEHRFETSCFTCNAYSFRVCALFGNSWWAKKFKLRKKNVRYLVARPGSPSTIVAAAALFASAANWYTMSKQSRHSWTMRRQHAISRLLTASVLLLKIISHEFLSHMINSLLLITEIESDFSHFKFFFQLWLTTIRSVQHIFFHMKKCPDGTCGIAMDNNCSLKH